MNERNLLGKISINFPAASRDDLLIILNYTINDLLVALFLSLRALYGLYLIYVGYSLDILPSLYILLNSYEYLVYIIKKELLIINWYKTVLLWPSKMFLPYEFVELKMS